MTRDIEKLTEFFNKGHIFNGDITEFIELGMVDVGITQRRDALRAKLSMMGRKCMNEDGVYTACITRYNHVPSILNEDGVLKFKDTDTEECELFISDGVTGIDEKTLNKIAVYCINKEKKLMIKGGRGMVYLKNIADRSLNIRKLWVGVDTPNAAFMAVLILLKYVYNKGIYSVNAGYEVVNEVTAQYIANADKRFGAEIKGEAADRAMELYRIYDRHLSIRYGYHYEIDLDKMVIIPYIEKLSKLVKERGGLINIDADIKTAEEMYNSLKELHDTVADNGSIYKAIYYITRLMHIAKKSDKRWNFMEDIKSAAGSLIDTVYSIDCDVAADAEYILDIAKDVSRDEIIKAADKKLKALKDEKKKLIEFGM